MEIKPGSMGKFTPGVEGAIVNPETGEQLPAGEKGVIAVIRDHRCCFKDIIINRKNRRMLCW